MATPFATINSDDPTANRDADPSLDSIPPNALRQVREALSATPAEERFKQAFTGFLETDEGKQFGQDMRRARLEGERKRLNQPSDSFKTLTTQAMLGAEAAAPLAVKAFGGGETLLGNVIGSEALKEHGRRLSRGSDLQLAELAEASEGINSGPAGRIAKEGATAALLSAPSIPAAAVGGMAGAVGFSALLSGGLSFEESKDYFLEQGLSQDRAERMAVLPGIVGGLATGLTTRLFGATGVERLTRPIGKPAFQSAFRNIVNQAGLEGIEEATDEFLQWVNQKALVNPDLTADDLAVQMAFAMGLGAGLGGAVETPIQIAQRIKGRPEQIDETIEQFRQQFGDDVFGPNGAGAPAFIRAPSDPLVDDDLTRREVARGVRARRRAQREATAGTEVSQPEPQDRRATRLLPPPTSVPASEAPTEAHVEEIVEREEDLRSQPAPPLPSDVDSEPPTQEGTQGKAAAAVAEPVVNDTDFGKLQELANSPQAIAARIQSSSKPAPADPNEVISLPNNRPGQQTVMVMNPQTGEVVQARFEGYEDNTARGEEGIRIAEALAPQGFDPTEALVSVTTPLPSLVVDGTWAENTPGNTLGAKQLELHGYSVIGLPTVDEWQTNLKKPAKPQPSKVAPAPQGLEEITKENVASIAEEVATPGRASEGRTLTGQARNLGLRVKTRDDLAAITSARASVRNRIQVARTKKDTDTVVELTPQLQFFREAIEAATNTGSGGLQNQREGSQGALTQEDLEAVDIPAPAAPPAPQPVEGVAQQVPDHVADLLPPAKEGFEFRIRSTKSFSPNSSEYKNLPRRHQNRATVRDATHVDVGDVLIDGETGDPVATWMAVQTTKGVRSVVLRAKEKTSSKLKSVARIPLQPLIEAGLVEEWIPAATTKGFYLSNKILNDVSQFVPVDAREKDILLPGSELKQAGKGKRGFGLLGQDARLVSLNEAAASGSFAAAAAPTTVAEDEQEATTQLSEQGFGAEPAEVESPGFTNAEARSDARIATSFVQRFEQIDPELADALTDHDPEDDAFWVEAREKIVELLTPIAPGEDVQGAIADAIEAIRDTLRVDPNALASLRGTEVVQLSSVDPALLNQPATGRDQILELVSAPNNGLSGSARETAISFLEHMNPKYLEGLTFVIQPGRQTVVGSSVEFGGTFVDALRLIKVSAGSSSATGVAEEFAHAAATFLPRSFRAEVSGFRAREIETLRASPEANQRTKDFLAELDRNGGEITSAQFARLPNAAELANLYPLINDDEFVAHHLTEAAAKARSGPTMSGIIDWLKNFFDQFVLALKQVFRSVDRSRDAFFDSVLSKLRNGEFDVSARGGALSEINKRAPIANLALTKQQVLQEFSFALAPARRSLGTIFATTNATLSDAFTRVVDDMRNDGFEVTEAVQRDIGLANLHETNEAIRATFNVDPQTYQTAIRDLPPALAEVLKNNMLSGIRFYEHKHDRLVHKRNTLAERLTSPKFAELVEQAITARQTIFDQEALSLSLRTQIDTGIAAAINAAKKDGASESQVEQALLERRFWEHAAEVSGGIAQKVELMTEAMEGDNQGAAMLMSPDTFEAGDIASVIQRVAPRLLEGGDRKVITDVALLWLARNTKHRAELLAQNYATSDNIVAAAGGLATRLAASLRAGDMAEVNRLINFSGRVQSDLDRAAHLYRTANRRIRRAINRFNVLNTGVEFTTRLTTDPEWLAFRQLVARDTGEIFVPSAWEKIGLPQHGASIIIPTPAGETYRVDFDSDTERWNAAQVSANEALNKIGEWLANADNLQKPERKFWQAWFDFASFMTRSSMATDFGRNYVFNLGGVASMVNNTLQIWEGLVRQIGVRAVQPAKVAMQTWVDSHIKFGQWQANAAPKIIVALFRASRSHALDLETDPREFRDVRDPNAVELVADWYERIGRELFARSQTQGVTFAAGDVLPDSGLTVTREDIAALEIQARSTDEAHRIDTRANKTFLVDSLVESEWIPGVTIRRKPLRIGERLLFRRFNPTALEFSRIYKKLHDAKDSTKIDDLLNAHFGEFVLPFLTDRSSDYSERTGLDEIYLEAAEQIRRGEIVSMAELDSFINERTTGDPDFGGATNFRREIRNMVLRVEKFAARPLEPDSNKVDAKLMESANSFTKGRGRRLGHYWFYNYGFRGTADIANFRLNGSSRFFDEIVNSARSVADALKAEQASRSAALNEGRNQPTGERVNEATARLRQRKLERQRLAAGDDTVEYDKLQSDIQSIERFLIDLEANFRPGGRMAEDETVFLNRLSGVMIGQVLTGVPTMIRNAFQGGLFYTGQRMSRLTNATLRSYGWALGSITKSMVTGLGGLAVDLPAAAAKSLVRIPESAGILWEGVQNVGSAAMRGRASKAWKEFVRSALLAESSLLARSIEDLSNANFQRSNVFRELRERGFDMPMAHKDHMDSMAESLSTWGQISAEGIEDRSRPIANFVSKTGKGFLAFVDFHAHLLLRPFFPRVGDLVANVSAANTAISGANFLEAHLRKRFLNNLRRGMPNRITDLKPSDVVPSWFGGDIDKTSMNEIVDWFGKAGIDLKGSINNYYARLEATPVADRKSVPWLTRQEKVSLALITMEEVNVATPANRPQVSRRSAFNRIAFALMGWNLNTLSRQLSAWGGAVERNSAAAKVLVPASVGAFFLSSLVTSALTNEGTEELIRMWYSLIGQERSTRQPWEREGTESIAKGFLIDAFSAIPFVATAVNVALNDLPTRRAFDPTILAQNQAVALADYVGGVVNTGDISFGAGRLVRSINPLVGQLLLNNLPETKGVMEAGNASRLLVRYGPFDLLKPPSGITRVGAVSTPLSPYGNRMINHAMLGEFDELEKVFKEALTVAESLGRANPEQSVRQLYSTRNPYTRAFKGKISAAQREATLARMRPDEREKILRTEELLKRGGEVIGVSLTFATGAGEQVRQLGGGLVQVRFARGGREFGRLRGSRSRRFVRDL